MLSTLKKIFTTEWRPHMRLWCVGGAMLVVLIILLSSMIRMIVGPTGERWRAVSQALDQVKEERLDPIRGSIYDSEGKPLAVTAPTYRLYMDFKASPIQLLWNDSLALPKDSVKIKQRDFLRDSLDRQLEFFAQALHESYATRGAEVSQQWFLQRLRQGLRSGSRYWQISPMKADMSYLQYTELKVLPPLEPKRNDDGKVIDRSLISKMLILEGRNHRINPFGSLALRTIGSVYSEQTPEGYSRGKQGLELQYDSLLRGQTGVGHRQRYAMRSRLKVDTPAIDGAHIYTTLDMGKQNLLERIMRNQLSYYSALSGSAILMEVETGKVLAMCNLEDSTRSGRYQEARNMAVSDMSEPGSTFKVASMLVALNDGVVSPDDIIDVGNGTWRVGGQTIRDHNYHRGGYGKITASEVIAYSSNVGTAQIIQRHYASRPDEYSDKIRALGFGYDLAFEIPGYARARIRKKSENPKRWDGTTLAWMSYGYITQIPPLYTVAFFNAIANGGRYMRPYLVREIRAADGTLIQQREPTVMIEQIARPEAIAQVQGMLRLVVEKGTGRNVRSQVVPISGKSGTAVIARGGSYRGEDGKSYEVSFCGYFPSDKPKYTMMVVLREPSTAFAASGGTMAGAVLKTLAEAIVSMETPQQIDRVPMPGSDQAHIAMGRLSELDPLMQQVGLPRPQTAGLEGDEVVRIDPSMAQAKVVGKSTHGLVPAVVGMSASDASFQLMRAGYKPRLMGHGVVKSQSVFAGTKAPVGSVVELELL